MTDNEIFNALFNGGNYTLPYLVELSNSTTSIYLVNDNNPVTYNGHTYAISTFDYTAPALDGSGGTLNITTIDNELFNLIEETPVTDVFTLTVIGSLVAPDKVQPLKTHKHIRGSVSVGEDLTAMFSLSADDRLEMQFPPYKFDTDNNRSNA